MSRSQAVAATSNSTDSSVMAARTPAEADRDSGDIPTQKKVPLSDDVTRKEFVDLLKWHIDCAHKHLGLFQVITLGVILGLINAWEKVPGIQFGLKLFFFVLYIAVSASVASMIYLNLEGFTKIRALVMNDTAFGETHAWKSGFLPFTYPGGALAKGVVWGNVAMYFACLVLIGVLLFR